jgi:hypothetical protein
MKVEEFRILSVKVLEGGATGSERLEHERLMAVREELKNEFIEMEKDYNLFLKCIPYIVSDSKETVEFCKDSFDETDRFVILPGDNLLLFEPDEELAASSKKKHEFKVEGIPHCEVLFHAKNSAGEYALQLFDSAGDFFNELDGAKLYTDGFTRDEYAKFIQSAEDMPRSQAVDGVLKNGQLTWKSSDKAWPLCLLKDGKVLRLAEVNQG